MRDVTSRLFRISAQTLVSTHTPHAGRDDHNIERLTFDCPFLLTRPMRDVTKGDSKNPSGTKVSTHTPHAGRDN